jgi:hypothetical protein
MIRMGIVRKLLLVLGALTLVVVGWMWWNQPARVDMAAYVPGDSLAYVEANSLPEIASAIVSTDAWQEAAPHAGINPNFGRLGWLGRLAAWTGLGPSESVVVGRAQVAVALLGFDAEVESDASAKISPRVALVAETHTGEGRVLTAVEKLVGEAARRRYGAVNVERKEIDGVPFVSWIAQSDPRRRLVAGVAGSVAVVARDESIVQMCLAAKRGERPTLAGDVRLQEMRERVGAGEALVFGYAPSGSAAKILEVVAPLFVGQISTNPNTQSSLAILLPKLANRIIGSAAWSSRVVKGSVEDRYYLDLPGDLAPRLSESLAPAQGTGLSAGELLPADTYQLSRYNYRDPEHAWRGLNAAISSQVDALMAIPISRAMEGLLAPYGIESPQEFLRAVGSEVVTARLESGSERKVLIVEARDRETLRRQVSKRLGPKMRTEKFGAEEILISADGDEGAASFVGERLLMGGEEDLRRCLTARAEKRTLATVAAMRTTDDAPQADAPQAGPPQVTTLSDDIESSRAFILFFARQRGGADKPSNAEAFESVLRQRPYSISETWLTPNGFLKKTHSSFGQFGWIVEQFATGGEAQK